MNCIILEGLLYGFGQLNWRTKPRVAEMIFFCTFLKTPIKLINFNF